jgi:hypothetical protein
MIISDGDASDGGRRGALCREFVVLCRRLKLFNEASVSIGVSVGCGVRATPSNLIA